MGYGDYGFINQDVPSRQRDVEKYLGSLFVFCGVVFIGAAAGTLLDEFANRAEIQAEKSLKKSEADIVHHTAEAFDLEKEICLLYGSLWKRELPTILITTLSGALCMRQL